MVRRLYLLVKRKNKKSWQIEKIKKGISKGTLKKIAQRNIKPGYQFKVLTESEMVQFITNGRN